MILDECVAKRARYTWISYVVSRVSVKEEQRTNVKHESKKLTMDPVLYYIAFPFSLFESLTKVKS
jgi:hypothetical protein